MSKKISKLKMTSSIAVWITVQMAKMFLFTVVWNKNNNAHKFTSIQPLQMLVVLLNQSQNSCVFFFFYGVTDLINLWRMTLMWMPFGRLASCQSVTFSQFK